MRVTYVKAKRQSRGYISVLKKGNIKMKKILAIVLAALMLVAFVGCGNTTEETNAPETDAPETEAPVVDGTEAPVVDGTEEDLEGEEDFEDIWDVEVPSNSSTDILNAAWGVYPEDQKFFAAGGFNEYMNMGGAGIMPTEGEDAILTAQTMFVLPESVTASIESMGGIMHGMNANTFTAGCFKLVDGASIEEFAAAVAENIKNNQWSCGFPEVHTIISVEGHVVSMFGHSEPVENFTQALLTAYSSAVVVSTQPLM